MKNVAEVNSEDILTELNNLEYNDEDLKLLDDEDIRPINNSSNDDLSDFYMDYKEEPKEQPKIDAYTEKEIVSNPAPVGVKPVEKKVEEKTVESKNSSVDDYLNRTTPQPNIKNEKKETINNPLINRANEQAYYNKPASQPTYKNQGTTENDLGQLLDKVSNNVKGASEIFNRNNAIRKRIEEKYNELVRLQEQHEQNKKNDYAEINSYKEEVYTKLQQKKADIEKDLTDLRVNQEKFDKEKKTFEDYKNSSLASLKALEKELKDSYDSRNRNIEQVEIGLVKRKEQLDIERSNLAQERAKIEEERKELATRLVQFNKLVDDFTNGMNNFE